MNKALRKRAKNSALSVSLKFPGPVETPVKSHSANIPSLRLIVAGFSTDQLNKELTQEAGSSRRSGQTTLRREQQNGTQFAC
ncbi:hypothetical protein N6L27_22470 [Leisingera sp. SS27]|uniref:hypothetical protein n=1 Tax=Leisingera sp. SS27 TaxID=2979462 RepID=UPI00232E03ED|nr:hypothetical protein [Leisingera sp. SS27]MDC0660780.1 hypothetical protein [Leisingera sp. SS27]